MTGALTLGVAWSGRRYRRDDAASPASSPAGWRWPSTTPGLFSDLERAERARAEIAETLQRGLLPPPLPHIPGWSVAAMYRPAGAENEVGGDFYDAFRVAGGWMLVIGDVTGRGARAASVTAQARYTLRTAAVLTGDPLVALATLNRALLARRDSALCSVAALDPHRRPAAAGAARGRRPPAAAARRRRAGRPRRRRRARSSAPSPTPLGARARWDRSRPAARRRHRRHHRGLRVRAAASARSACGPSWRRRPARRSAVQQLEGALHSLHRRRADDDAAILASPAPREPCHGRHGCRA